MNIRIFLIILISAAMVGSYGSNSRRNSNTDILAMTVRDTAAEDSVQVEDSTGAAQFGTRTLNEIRFDGWTGKDWIDNDYYRCIRKTFDDYFAGKIEREDFDKYRDIISGKFVLWDYSVFLLGGLIVRIVFIDNPTLLFETWVYGLVDEEKEEVVGYEMHGLTLLDQKTSFTTESLLELLEEHPEYKMY